MSGVEVRANIASTGTLSGFSFGLDGYAFKGSQLGKNSVGRRSRRRVSAMSKTEIANSYSVSPEQGRQIQTISELQSMLATISGQLSEFQSLTDSQLRESISLLTDQTQSKLDQLQNTTTKQLSETLEVVATDTRKQIFQSMTRANEAAEETLSAMQQEASRAYDEPVGELLKQVRSISEAMTKLSDEARRALVSEVKVLRAQNSNLKELTQHIGKLSKNLEASARAAAKETRGRKLRTIGSVVSGGRRRLWGQSRRCWEVR